MNKIRIAINGFGRIGRVAMRLLLKDPRFQIVALNDVNSAQHNKHLLRYDSVHGTFECETSSSENTFTVNGQVMDYTSQRDPLLINWGKSNVDIVLECTGAFTSYDGAQKHLQSGAKKVIVSAPCKDNAKIKTLVYGINHQSYEHDSDHIVSNASCTTNCLAPVVKVLHDNFKVKQGFMTTIHSYTNDQRILDVGHSDYRRMRAAALNMIPTTTGAAKAVALVIPELKGKLTGLAVRVPTPNVSLVDFVANVERATTVEEVNSKITEASQAGPLTGLLRAITEPLVSSDFNGCTASSSVDLLSTMVIEGTMIKILSWYDNETGFSQRMIDLAAWMGRDFK